MPYSTHSLLVITLRQLGDALLITPLVRSLRRAHPQARIDVLTFAGRDGMFSANPDINQVITLREHSPVREFLGLLWQIARGYDWAVSTQSGDRPLLLALAAGRCRACTLPPRDWQFLWKHWICQQPVVATAHTHIVLQNLQLADALGVPRCYELVAPATRATQRISALLPFAWQNESFAVLHPPPLRRYKRWHANGWQTLANHLHRIGLRVVISSGPGREDQTYLAQLLPLMPAGTIAAIGLSLAELAEMLRRARLYIGPDTSITHLAAAVGIPTIALYGPTDPRLWSPWPQGYAQAENPFARHAELQICHNVALVQGAGECVPCQAEGCERHRDSHSRCLDALRAEAVLAAVTHFMA